MLMFSDSESLEVRQLVVVAEPAVEPDLASASAVAPAAGLAAEPDLAAAVGSDLDYSRC